MFYQIILLLSILTMASSFMHSSPRSLQKIAIFAKSAAEQLKEDEEYRKRMGAAALFEKQRREGRAVQKPADQVFFEAIFQKLSGGNKEKK